MARIGDSDPERHIREAIGGYAEPLVRLLGESYGPDSLQQAWREFTFDANTPFTGTDAHSELFFSWLFHSWSPTVEKGNSVLDSSVYGICPTRVYLGRNSSNLHPILTQYLQGCLDTPLGFYAISDCRSGIGFHVRNMLTGVEHDMIEALASVSLQDGDIIFARIPSIGPVPVMDAISPISFPPSFEQQLRDGRAEPQFSELTDLSLRTLYFRLLESYLGANLPEIRNSGGSILVGTLIK